MITPKPESRATQGWSVWLIATVSAFVALMAIATWSPWSAHRTSEPTIVAAAAVSPSIAVLPFVDLTKSNSDQSFSDAFSEDLRQRLAKAPKLHVASRTATLAYKDYRGEVRDLGREIKIATVLQGSVRRSGNTIFVTAQLLDVANGRVRWSQTFERGSEDVAGVREKIVAAVLADLKVEFLPPEAPGASDPRSGDQRVHALRQPVALLPA